MSLFTGRTFQPPPAPDMSREGLFSMLAAGLDGPDQRRALLPGAGILALGWAGFVGISGAHLGSPWQAPLFGLVPRPALFALALAALLGAAMFFRRTPLASLAAMVAAYLVGNLLSGALHLAIDPSSLFADRTATRFVVSRLLYATAVALPMLLVAGTLLRGRGTFYLGVGRWNGISRITRDERPRTWAMLMAGFLVVAALPFFLLMQAQVGFGPLQSGRLPGLLPALVAMAFANAFAEELIFRGLLQGAATPALGPARGIWAVSMMFGLHHLGASFAPLASLPGALLVGVGSVLFGKAVCETRGLAWAVCAHAAINVGTFAAFYVAV